MNINQKALNELKDSMEECEAMIASEKLGGNVVKEEFWKGKLCGLRAASLIVENS